MSKNTGKVQRMDAVISKRGGRKKTASRTFLDGERAEPAQEAPDIYEFTAQNEATMTAIHELGHYWVGEKFDSIGHWVAIDTPECRSNYPEIWALLDNRHLSGCCRLSVPELHPSEEYCWVLAGWEAQRLFLSEHGYRGAVYTRWRNYDNAKRISLYAMTDQARIADNACSRDPRAKAKAKALIQRVLSKTRPDTQKMLNILLKQGALILNPHKCPVCTEAGYEINYRFGTLLELRVPASSQPSPSLKLG